jgi:hypothetical protein
LPSTLSEDLKKLKSTEIRRGVSNAYNLKCAHGFTDQFKNSQNAGVTKLHAAFKQAFLRAVDFENFVLNLIYV